MTKWLVLALVPALLVACSKEEAAPPATPIAHAQPAASMNIALLAAAPEEALANELVTYTAAAGHHFEVKAPQKCGGVEPTELTARKVVCQFTTPGTHTVALNVCDDAKQYCKPVRYELTATAPQGFVADGSHPKVLQPPKQAHREVAGFLANQTDEAVALAKAEGKLLFIHFYGIWCPPCNLLEEHVYADPAFLDATTSMVRVMIDADSDLSWAWKAHFKVGGYPTVVIATPELSEIDRLVGYRPTAGVVKWASAALANRDAPIATLLAAHADPNTADAAVRKRIGEYHAARREWDDAVKWLSEHSDAEARMTWKRAQQEVAKRDGDEVRATQITQELVKEFPNHIKYASWVEELIEKKVPDAASLVAPALANIEAWKVSSELPETGYGLGDVWWMQASLHAAAGDVDAAKAAYRKAADFSAELAKTSTLTVARGANMDRAYALHKAGDNEAAKALYEELTAAYADEFSFNYNYAHVLNELEERDKAYEFVKKAEAASYGDNWLRAVHLRAKIEHAMGNGSAAVQTIDKALAEAIVPRSEDVRTHGYLKRLRELRVKVSAPAL